MEPTSEQSASAPLAGLLPILPVALIAAGLIIMLTSDTRSSTFVGTGALLGSVLLVLLHEGLRNGTLGGRRLQLFLALLAIWGISFAFLLWQYATA